MTRLALVLAYVGALSLAGLWIVESVRDLMVLAA